MTAAPRDDAKYVRVYYRITDDPKFADIYGDDRHLATWLRLLIVADGMWPVAPPVPRTVRKPSLSALVRAGLVDLMPQDCYRIHGLDAERAMRSQSGRNAAAMRWDSKRTPPTDADPMLVRDRVRVRAESESEHRARNGSVPDDEDGYETVVRWLASRKAWADSPKLQTDLARMVDRKGAPAVIAAMAALDGAEDAAQFVYGARNALFPLAPPKVQTKDERDRAEARRELGLA